MTVNIRLKSIQGKSRLNIKYIVSIIVQFDMECIRETVTVICKDTQNLIGNSVQSQILFTGGIITSIILKCQRIRQDIGSNQFIVSVINITPGTFEDSRFRRPCLKFINIILSLYNLQLIELSDQDKRQHDK